MSLSRRGAPWALLCAVACGDPEPRVYDVTLDEAELADATRECSITGRSQVGPVNLPAQQRWTIRETKYGGSSLELPDFSFTLEGREITLDNGDRPFVIEGGTNFDKGPYEYVLFDRYVQLEPRATYFQALRFYIANEELEENITGFIWFRNEYSGELTPSFPDRECTFTFPLTGRRVSP